MIIAFVTPAKMQFVPTRAQVALKEHVLHVLLSQTAYHQQCVSPRLKHVMCGVAV